MSDEDLIKIRQNTYYNLEYLDIEVNEELVNVDVYRIRVLYNSSVKRNFFYSLFFQKI